MGTFEVVVDHWLNASFSAGNVITHGIEAGLSWVDLDDCFEGVLASAQFVLVILALGLAFFEQERLGVLAVFEHLLDVSGFTNVWLKSWLRDCPSRG